MSDDDYEEYIDEVEELVTKLRANDRTVKRLRLWFEKWEDMPEQEAIGEAIQLFRALEDNTTVKEVDLGHVLYFSINENLARVIARSLVQNQSVQDVCIRCADFEGQREMRIVLESLVNNNRIKSLSICGHEDYMEPPPALIGRSLSNVLGDVLRTNSSMEKLVLIDDAVEWDDMSSHGICSGLKENISIKTLDLAGTSSISSSSRLPVWACDDLCKAVSEGTKVRLRTHAHGNLASLIATHSNIEELIVFVHRQLEHDEWLALADGVSSNRSIKKLSLVQDPGVSDTFDTSSDSLFKAIARVPIEKVLLEEIPLGDAAISIICKALCRSQSLSELKINCRMARHRKVEIPITAEGATHLGNLIRSCGSLESLVIDSDHSSKVTFIGDEGAVIIAKAIAERGMKATKLSLSNCNIWNRGGRACRNLLFSPNVMLEDLDLSGNSFSLAVCKEFADCLRDNSILQSLNLAGPRDESREIGDDARIHLIGALKNNHTLKSLYLPYGRLGGIESSTEGCSRTDSTLREVLMSNHTLSYLFCYNGNETLVNYISCANINHPVLASTMKGAPFPARLINDIQGIVMANAIERANAIAGIDGVFSLLRQVGDEIATHSFSKKRARND